ncbi:hypothetical protein ATCCBAA256_23650 [Mycobacterium montefiorense]|nr:hypothetical protein ATCCBAA256_23650 [Mycobacterium montefiorense]
MHEFTDPVRDGVQFGFDGFGEPRGIEVAGDERAGRVGHDQQIVRLGDAVFEDGNDVGQFGHSDDRPGSGPE